MNEVSLGNIMKEALIKDILEEKFLSLRNVERAFSYMVINGLITRETYEKVAKSFEQSNRYPIIQYSNGDIKYSFQNPEGGGTESLCNENNVKKLYDVFNPVDYAAWVIELLYHDKKLKEKFSFRNFRELIGELSVFRIPAWYLLSFAQFLSIAPNVAFYEKRIFYLYKVDGLNYELRYQIIEKCGIRWSPEEGPLIREGLSQNFFVVRNDVVECIYCSIANTNDLFCFDLKEMIGYVVKDSSFLGVNGKGQEVLVLGKKQICVMVEKEANVIHEYSENMVYKVMPDYVLAWHNNVGEVCRPECYSYEGGVIKSDTKDAAYVFWKKLLHDSADAISLQNAECISELLVLDKITKAPEILTIRNLRIRCTELVELGFWQKREYLAFNNILELLEYKGTTLDEDVTDIMYNFLEENPKMLFKDDML